MYPWLRKRVEASLRMIDDFRSTARNPYLSCSFGKDSLTLLWLVRQVVPHIPVVWFDWGKWDEHPETAHFAETVSRAWNLKLSIIRAELSPEEQWIRFGIPESDGSAEDGYQRQFLDAFYRESASKGYDGHYIGMRAAESHYRRFVFSQRGPVYFANGDRLWRCNPLWNWPTKAVWELIDSERLPTHPIYSQTRFQRREEIRLGVITETRYASHGSLAHLRYYYPSRWNELCAQFPELAGFAS